ncbi:glycosyltransferase [Staphylococcus cohnii]|uniref:glycosyltransferase n=1 Tax=Staphylococcus cohnii TaxID=29382 RepID=UPI00374F09C9
MIKVMHIFSRMNRGGAELRTIDTMKILNREFEFHVCATSGKKGELDDELESMGITMHYLDIKKFSFPFKFIKLLKKKNIDVVHSHILFMSGLIQLLSFLSKVKNRITHFRTSKDSKEQYSKIRKARNKVLKIIIEIFSTKILYVSNLANRNLISRKIFLKKHKTLYNGFEISELNKNFEKEENSFIYVGRFFHTKNQLFLLDVIENLKKEFNTSIEITFVGNIETDYGKKFLSIANERGLNKNIKIIGEVNNPLDYLKTSEYFLFPSELEGLPGALIEAHLHKCIVISSNIKENAEVNEYFTESSFELELNPKTWASTIEKLISGKKHVSFNDSNAFDINMTTQELKEIYMSKTL